MFTFIGIFVVPLGAYWFLKLNTKRLLQLFAATTPFSAASIIEFKGSVFGMVPSFYVALLLICVFIINLILGKSKIKVDAVRKYYYLCFASMWLYYLLSLIFPAILLLCGSSYELFNPAFEDKIYSNDIPIYTFTQFVYFTCFLFTSLVIMNETVNTSDVKGLLKIILRMTTFTILWGFFFYILNLTGLAEYPAWVFNNHPGYAQGFNQKVGLLSRMSSVAQEPSVYGYFLSIMLSLVMMLNMLDFYVLKQNYQQLLCLLLMAASIMTTSTTAFFGILTSIMMTILLSALCGKFYKAMKYLSKQLLILSAIIAGLFFIILNKFDFDINNFIDIFYFLTFQKGKTGSGEERSESFFHGINVLSDTFYLGSGFASNRNFDIGSTILSNTGIIGLTLFLCSFGGVIVFSLVKIKMSIAQTNEFNDTAKIAMAFVAALMTALILMFISIPDFVNMYFWLILGLLMGVTKLISSKATPELVHTSL